jgi:hypothetical protein
LPVAGQEIARDPVQPGPRLRSFGVKARPLLECDAKELPQQRVGVIGTDPTHEVPEQRRRVPVEELAEGGRRVERARDDLSIGARIHHFMFLARSDEFGASASAAAPGVQDPAACPRSRH